MFLNENLSLEGYRTLPKRYCHLRPNTGDTGGVPIMRLHVNGRGTRFPS
jgi:hypothetical protein